MSTKTPRGIRNNNPLNIRIGNSWQGERPNPTDKQFEQFVSMEYGLRAGFIILRRYITHYKRNTVQKIISSWAPASENNVNAYVKSVCSRSGISRSRVLTFSDTPLMVALVEAMCFHENGQAINIETIRRAYSMV